MNITPKKGHEPPGPAVIRIRRGQFHDFIIQCATRFGFCARGILKIAACLALLLEVCPAVASTPALHSRNGALVEGCSQAAQSAFGCLSVPASGYRANDSGGLTNVSSNGNYWSFAPNSQTNARNLNFNSGNVNPLNNNNRANGFSVRPSRALKITDLPWCDVFMKYDSDQIHRLATAAYLKAREHERNTPAQLAFEINLEREISALTYELLHRTWAPGPLDWFVLTEPSVREVFAPQFRDRVVSHILVSIIGPIFERHFIYDSHSCRVGKGTLNGIQRFEHHVRSVTNNFTRPGYCLNIDISGYFMSINRAILYSITWETLDKYRKRFPDAIDYDFVDYIISAFLWRDPLEGCIYHGNPELKKLVQANKSMWYQEPGVGISIGDVRNQLNSNIYLNPFDHYALRILLVQGYDRYVDDLRELHESYNYLVECRERSGDFLSDRLHLTLHPNKTTITDLYDTNYFLGAAISPYRRYAMEGTITRLRNFMDESEAEYVAGVPIDWVNFISSINARLGYLQHFREVKSIDRIMARAPQVCSMLNFTQNYTKATLKN